MAAHPFFAPSVGGFARRAVAPGARQTQEQQIAAFFGEKLARVFVADDVLLFVVDGRGSRLPQTTKDARERLAQFARLGVERARIIADLHAERERERLFRVARELFDGGAQVVEPPRIAFAEAAPDRG